jgi:type IV pilus assembly protein PilP
MKSLRWMLSYIFVALVGLWMAFAVSAKLMMSARAQDPAVNAPAPETAPGVVPEESPVAEGVNAEMPNPEIPPPPPAATEEALGANPDNSILQGEGYSYDPTGKRDPFKPVGLKVLGLPKPVTLEPLQRFELDKLQVIGILWDVRSPRAMVRDPEGVMHTVVKNSKIGRSEGFVAAIREGELVVVETLYDEGKAVKQTRVMELKKGTKAL